MRRHSRSLARSAQVLSTALLGLLLSPGSASPQMPGTGCPECRIAVRSVAVLGEEDAPDLIAHPAVAMALGPDGTYALATHVDPFLQLFDSTGAFVRDVGRSGQGPGEFRMIMGSAFRADGGLDVIDAAGRVVGFGPDLRVDSHRVTDFQPSWDVLRIRGDSVLVAGYSRSSDLIGLAAHVFPSNGGRARSFGELAGTIASQDPYRISRTVSASGDSAVWIAPLDRYHLELWSLEGVRLRTIEGEVSWFDPLPEPKEGSGPPRGHFKSVLEKDGLLWISASVPRDDWQAQTASSLGSWYRTVVHVLDAESGVLLATHEFPPDSEAIYGRLFGDVRLARGFIDIESGRVIIEVLQLTLER